MKSKMLGPWPGLENGIFGLFLCQTKYTFSNLDSGWSKKSKSITHNFMNIFYTDHSFLT